MAEQGDIARLTRKLIEFRDARDWAQYHNPKDLALALGIEVAELQEHFLWRKEVELSASSVERGAAIAEEAADVAAYLFLLCASLDIDLVVALDAKIAKNGKKYPVDKVRGSARKYTEY